MTTAKITSKGQLTLPREALKRLVTDTVEIELFGDEVRLRPVWSVAGVLRGYGGKKAVLKDIRNKVREEAAKEKK
jgi:bifunctional DNA-binding transcriptional regulator/antitoxin component of YhaV-PrlF toxin-antitoxin module